MKKKSKPKEPGQRVECAFDSMVATGDLKPNPRNPNKHPKKQLELLSKIIKAQGWRNPIVVSNLSGFVTKGHARLEAAKILGLTEVPVDFQDYDTPESEMADMLADNRLAELAEPDLPLLKDILLSLDTGAFDMDLTGFDTESIESLMTQYHIPEDNKDIDEDAMKDTKNECPKCGFKW
jgi:ParB-like chromosome segregation protein Spo0J